jgi:hypothetical protein
MNPEHVGGVAHFNLLSLNATWAVPEAGSYSRRSAYSAGPHVMPWSDAISQGWNPAWTFLKRKELRRFQSDFEVIAKNFGEAGLM